MRHDCDVLGLTADQRARLTGFSGRAIRALAHLREAWCGADEWNQPRVEEAIRALLATHSLAEVLELCDRALTFGLDAGRADSLRVAVGLRAVR